MATQFLRDIGDKGFLVLVGGINTVNMALSLITLYALEKSRNGAVIVISEIVGAISLENLAVLFLAALIAGCSAVWLAAHLSKLFSAMITKVNYQAVVISILLFTALLVFYFDGWCHRTSYKGIHFADKFIDINKHCFAMLMAGKC